MTKPQLIATCWTSAGASAPLDSPELSPMPIMERLDAIAAAGWMGFGLGQDDLRAIKDTVGFKAVYDRAQELGLSHIEVELATNWWMPADSGWRDTWEVLLEAADDMKAKFIKIGTTFSEPIEDFTFMVEPLRKLADEAAAVGTKLALEPLPFATIASMPQGADLIREVNHPAAGLCVDFWHIFRANTTLEEMAARVPVEIIFSVELSDARNEIVGTLFEDTINNRTLITEGDQDVVGFIRTLQKMGFNLPYGVEILSKEHRARPVPEGLKAAYDTAIHAFELAAQ